MSRSQHAAREPGPDELSPSTTGRLARAGVRRLSGSVRNLFEAGGSGFRDLAMTQVASTAADTLVAIGLAGTLFFSVPSAEARGNVALYLLLTVAPFALIGPVLGRLLDRAPVATRSSLVVAAIGRGILAVLVLGRLDSLWLFPAAFGLLVLSRVHGITRNALTPLALDDPTALVAANARLAWIGVLGGGIAAPIGVAAVWATGSPDAALALSAIAALAAATIGRRLPEPDAPGRRAAPTGRTARLHLPRRVRTAQVATAAVRLINGFLLLLLAFAFRTLDAGVLDIGAVLGAAGLGFAGRRAHHTPARTTAARGTHGRRRPRGRSRRRVLGRPVVRTARRGRAGVRRRVRVGHGQAVVRRPAPEPTCPRDAAGRPSPAPRRSSPSPGSSGRSSRRPSR